MGKRNRPAPPGCWPVALLHLGTLCLEVWKAKYACATQGHTSARKYIIGYVLFNFTFKAGLLRWGSYAFFNWCRSWILRNKKKDTVNQPPIGYRVPASRHWFVQTQRNGGSENQSRRFKWACQIVCSTTAFFLLPSSGSLIVRL